MEVEQQVSDELGAQQDASVTDGHPSNTAVQNVAAPTFKCSHRYGTDDSSPATSGAAPATLHAADMLVMAKQYVSIFIQQHPHRRPPGLFADTVSKQEALLTQLLRPTQAPALCPAFVNRQFRPSGACIASMYGFDEASSRSAICLQVAIAELACTEAAAAFVSGYVDYQPLPQPYMMPDSVQRPELTLQRRSGNSLDMALLLCSLLLGQGADAAVVLGYAPPGIVQNVQRDFRCPARAAGQQAGSAALSDRVLGVLWQPCCCGLGRRAEFRWLSDRHAACRAGRSG